MHHGRNVGAGEATFLAVSNRVRSSAMRRSIPLLGTFVIRRGASLKRVNSGVRGCAFMAPNYRRHENSVDSVY